MLKWGVPVVIVGIALVWCFFEAGAFMSTEDGMVGFHPCVIFAVPFAFILSLGLACWAWWQKSGAIGLCSVLPIVILGLPLFYGYELGIYGWSNEIRDKSQENESAIRLANFSSAVFDEVPYKDHQRMIGIPGFRWNKANKMVAAKNGTFHGFMVNSVRHVYICPLKNGARGIAWVTDTSEINNDSSVRYEYSGVENWYIWTMAK